MYFQLYPYTNQQPKTINHSSNNNDSIHSKKQMFSLINFQDRHNRTSESFSSNNQRELANNVQISPLPKDDPPPSPKKMLWGEPTWFLLHTISCKVKEETFSSVRSELLNIIYSICCNLPCPDCASHAKEHLNGINFNTIQTKEQLKLMLFYFHNMVNRRKNYPEFLLEDLDEKYSKANFKNVIKNFIYYYTNTRGSIKMISDDFYRKKLVENMIDWLNKRSVHFDF